jgi:uncharacterized protein (TIGR03435 family)
MRLVQTIVFLAAGMLVGQDVAPLRFEVVSIRVAAPITARGEVVGGRTGGPGMPSPEHVSWRYIPVGSLMETGYGVRRQQIAGPDWLFSFDTAFDIQATAAPGMTPDQFKAMTRAMLEERFGLKVHREIRELDAYVLTAKEGTELKSDLVLDPSSNQYKLLQSGRKGLMIGTTDGGVLVAGNATAAELAAALEDQLEESAILVDRTGLTGLQKIAIHFSHGKRGSDDPKWPSMFRALEDIGLKVERKKEPVEILVVDHIEKAPTAN